MGVADDSSGLKVKKAILVNILEDDLEVLDLADGRLSLSYKPFEIKTIKLVL